MAKRKQPESEDQLEWSEFKPIVQFPTIAIPQSDGSFIIKPGKPQVISGEVGCTQAAKLVGLSASRIMQLCSEGKIQARQPSGFKGKYLIPLSEIERLRKFVQES